MLTISCSTWTTCMCSAIQTISTRSVTPNARKLTAKYGDIILWDDIGQSDFSAVLLQSTWQHKSTRVNLAYTLGWYQGDFDTAGLPNFAYPFLFNRQATTGDERHRIVLSDIIQVPLGFTVSSIATLASPRPFLTTVGTRRQSRQRHRRMIIRAVQ